MSLKILMVSVEVAPFAKVGGLADVAGSLPKQLCAMGHDARIAMPNYGMALDSDPAPTAVVPPFDVQVNASWKVKSTLHETTHDGVPVWLIGGGGFFDGIHSSGQVYSPGRDAYLYWAKAILAACEKAGWIPDIIHCNDWHTGFLPVVLRELGGEKWAKTASVFTIHNLAYQGDFGRDTLDVLELPGSLYNMQQLENFGGVNFLKSGCVFADMVNTVSPTYAKEIQTERYGAGQWGLMRDLDRLGRLRGILNGIDTDFFDPTQDPYIAQNYSADDLSGKEVCKAALQKELGFEVDPEIPIFGMVTRLSNQKGFEVIFQSAYGWLDKPAQFVLLAMGDPWAASEMRRLEGEWPDRVRFFEKYDADLAQRIYAGSDLFLMPSNFEPCGLGQMIAFRYGTMPIVRKTGGLADSVFEGVNGFVYENQNAREFFEAVKRGLDTWNSKEKREEVIRTGMRRDATWRASALEYEAMYNDALSFRKSSLAVK